MPDWLVERGIGETRAILVDKGAIVEARILLDGAVPAGTVVQAVLRQTGKPAVAADGSAEFLLPNGAPAIPEGAGFFIEVTREAIPGAEPWKRPLARVAEGPARGAAQIGGEGLAFPAAPDRLEQTGWSDLFDEARSGIVRFAGGELRVSPTPAMTLIDVDGYLPPSELALAGAVAAALAIRRHGIGGSIGIDLPTLSGKAQRQAVDSAIDAHLPKPFERTAVNGFGFIQIVRPRRHASLLELAQDRAAFEARALLRRTAFEPAGSKRLAAHPAVIAVIQANPGWAEALAGQVGGAIGLRPDPSIPIHGGYAEPF